MGGRGGGQEGQPEAEVVPEDRCRAQLTVSRLDPALATPAAHIAELAPDPVDPEPWVVELRYTEVGWFGTEQVPAVGVLRFDADRGVVVGVWAKADVYPLDAAVAVADEVAASVGRP